MKEGLSRLFSLGNVNKDTADEMVQVSLSFIKPNPYQPRKEFEPLKIEELAQSIKTYGLLQPIILKETGKNKYQIVAGERRYLACKKLGWETIPALLRRLDSSGMTAVALIENLQRENLNFMEEAAGYMRLIKEFSLTQEILAQRLGKSQSTIANKLRLLKLPEEVKETIVKESLSERHARSLLKLKDDEEQRRMLHRVVKEKMTVKETEGEVNRTISRAKEKNTCGRKERKVVVRDLRIFLNTIRQAVNTIKRFGLSPQVTETDRGDYFEVTIILPKK